MSHNVRRQTDREREKRTVMEIMRLRFFESEQALRPRRDECKFNYAAKARAWIGIERPREKDGRVASERRFLRPLKTR